MTIRLRRNINYWFLILFSVNIVILMIISKMYYAYSSNSSDRLHIVKLNDWGVNISVPINTITNKENINKDQVDLGSEETIIVAPGDSDSLTYTLNGTPSVNSINATCSYNIVVTNPEKWNADGIYYFPVKFAIEASDMSEVTENEQDWTKVVYDVQSVPVEVYVRNEYYDKMTATQNENTLTLTTTETLTKGNTYEDDYKGIAWDWKYYESDEKDKLDTSLGNYDIEAPQFELQVKINMEWDVPKTNTDTSTTELVEETSNSENTIKGNRTTASTTEEQGRTLRGDRVTNEATNVKTGDTFNMYLWTALFVIATVTIITTVTILIRNNTKNKSNEQEN